MFTFQCRRSPAKKRGFALPPLSVFQRSGLTETVCGRPQGSLAALRRCAAQNPDGFCLENDAVLHKGTFPSGRRRIYFLHPQVPLWFETSAFRTDKPAPRTLGRGIRRLRLAREGSHPPPGARRKALKGLAANQARSEVGRKNPARRVAQSFPDAFECQVTQNYFL